MKLLRSATVRPRFALFLALLASTVACSRASDHLPADAAVDVGLLYNAPQNLDAGKICLATPGWPSLNFPPVDVLILFDNSESMGIGYGSGTRVSALSGFLADLVDAYQSRIRFGFAHFPDQDALCPGLPVAGCCVGRPSESDWIPPGDPARVQQALQTLPSPQGNSPLASALKRVPEYLEYDDMPRYVLLATDGVPSCTLSGGLSSSQPGDGGKPSGCQDALAQVQILSSVYNIKVIVLAVGGEADDPAGPLECMDQIARASDMARAEGEQGYYSVTSQDALRKTIIEKIFGVLEPLSCELSLEDTLISETLVHVYLDNQEIPRSRDNGWDFASPGNYEKVRIFGEYCKRIQQLRYSTCTAIYSCISISSMST